jgi:hypothetical protein
MNNKRNQAIDGEAKAKPEVIKLGLDMHVRQVAECRQLSCRSSGAKRIWELGEDFPTVDLCGCHRWQIKVQDGSIYPAAHLALDPAGRLPAACSGLGNFRSLASCQVREFRRPGRNRSPVAEGLPEPIGSRCR